MPRDYARNRSKSRKQPQGHRRRNYRRHQDQTRQIKPLLWLSVGLTIGFFIAGLIYLHNTGHINATLPGTHNIVDFVNKEKQSKQVATNKTKPRFDFYTLLSRKDEKELINAESTQVTKKISSKKYVLQVAAFKKFSDADHLKAQLAMLGYHAKIQKAQTGKTIWNRVTLGPYTSEDSANEVRYALQKEKIGSFLLVKK